TGPVSDKEIDATQNDERLLGRKPVARHPPDEQDRRGGGCQSEQLADRQAAFAVEIGQEAAECREPRTQEDRSPVHLPLPGRHASIGGTEQRGKDQMSPITRHRVVPYLATLLSL